MGSDVALGSVVLEVESNVVSVLAICGQSSVPDLGWSGLGLWLVNAFWGSNIDEASEG